ncbi:MAG: hypothetical protein ABSG15_15310, partial [FCB group bacterium]
MKDTKQSFLESVDDVFKWYENYKNNLYILKEDHELLVNEGYNIIFAIDSSEIIPYAYPYIDLDIKDLERIKIDFDSDYSFSSKTNFRITLNNIIRDFIFNHLSSYQKFVVIPHNFEVFHRIEYLHEQINSISQVTLKSKFNKLYKNIPIDNNKKLEFIMNNYKTFSLLYMCLNKNGLNIIRNLYNTIILTEPQLDSDYFELYDEISKGINISIIDDFNNIRKYEDYIEKMQKLGEKPIPKESFEGKNITDAMVINFINKVNHKLYKKRILLISNAESIEKYSKLKHNNFNYLRNLNLFLTYIILSNDNVEEFNALESNMIDKNHIILAKIYNEIEYLNRFDKTYNIYKEYSDKCKQRNRSYSNMTRDVCKNCDDYILCTGLLNQALIIKRKQEKFENINFIRQGIFPDKNNLELLDIEFEIKEIIKIFDEGRLSDTINEQRKVLSDLLYVELYELFA